MANLPAYLAQLREENYPKFIAACKRGGKASAEARKKKTASKILEAERLAEEQDVFNFLAARKAVEEEQARLEEGNYHILLANGKLPDTFH